MKNYEVEIDIKIQNVVKKVVDENVKDVHSENVLYDCFKKVSETLLNYFDIDIFSIIEEKDIRPLVNNMNLARANLKSFTTIDNPMYHSETNIRFNNSRSEFAREIYEKIIPIIKNKEFESVWHENIDVTSIRMFYSKERKGLEKSIANSLKEKIGEFKDLKLVDEHYKESVIDYISKTLGSAGISMDNIRNYINEMQKIQMIYEKHQIKGIPVNPKDYLVYPRPIEQERDFNKYLEKLPIDISYNMLLNDIDLAKKSSYFNFEQNDNVVSNNDSEIKEDSVETKEESSIKVVEPIQNDELSLEDKINLIKQKLEKLEDLSKQEKDLKSNLESIKVKQQQLLDEINAIKL